MRYISSIKRRFRQLSRYSSSVYRQHNPDRFMFDILIIDLFVSYGRKQTAPTNGWKINVKCTQHLNDWRLPNDMHFFISHEHFSCSHQVQELTVVSHAFSLAASNRSGCSCAHIYTAISWMRRDQRRVETKKSYTFRYTRLVVSLCIDCGIEAYFVEREAEEKY